jgi:RNA polymerase sigma-70 factor (ECF subfamily)
VTSDTAAVVQSDAELLRQVASQDREAFLELYDRFSARLLGLIITVMRNRTQAEDVLQQVMLEIWQRHAAKYSPELGSVDSWLLRLARCRAIDWARSASSRTAVSVETVPDVPTSWTPAASGNDEAQQSLVAAVGELPEEERVPMILAYVQGLTREEIAEQCGVPVGTIKTRLRRGIQRLRESLPVGVSQ